jgi:hypothetical protein
LISGTFILAEFHLTSIWPGAAGDHVHHRAFARAVRTDDGAQLAFVHVEVQVVDRLESVKGFVDAFEQQNKFFDGLVHTGLAGCISSTAGVLAKRFL